MQDHHSIDRVSQYSHKNKVKQSQFSTISTANEALCRATVITTSDKVKFIIVDYLLSIGSTSYFSASNHIDVLSVVHLTSKKDTCEKTL